jgi:hypothetical protein
VNLAVQAALSDLVNTAFLVLLFNLRRIDSYVLAILPQPIRKVFTTDGAPSPSLRLAMLFAPGFIFGIVWALGMLLFEGSISGNPREEWIRNFGVGQPEYIAYQHALYVNGIVIIGIGCVGAVIALLSRWQTPMGKAFFLALPLLFAGYWFAYWYVGFHTAAYVWYHVAIGLAIAGLLILGYRAFIK